MLGAAVRLCTLPWLGYTQEVVGVDYVPAAIEAAAAKSRAVDGLSYVVGDMTRLPSAHLGMFDFFLETGCFQGLDAGQRLCCGYVRHPRDSDIGTVVLQPAALSR